MQHISSSTAKKSKRQSKLFSWMFTSHDASSSATKDDAETTTEYGSTKIELTVSDYTERSLHDFQIPNRRQSHLYNSDTVSLDNYQLKRRSYLPPSHNESSSSLTRSATWQPSTPKNTQINAHNDNLNIDDIPTRRTSRNYSDNPEIQAKLNAVLNSDRISHMIQHKQRSPLSKQN